MARIANTSSAELSAKLVNGSGDEVTAARAAVFPPWAASAIVPPIAAAASCHDGPSDEVAA